MERSLAWSWSVLHLSAWSFGLYAVDAIRRENPPRARAWLFLYWAVWTCLLAELFLLAARAAPGLRAAAGAVGAAGAVLLYLGLSALRRDLCWGRPELFSESFALQAWNRRLALAAAAVSLLCAAAGAAFPARAAAAAALLDRAGGALWLGVSAYLAAALWRVGCIEDARQADTPRLLAASLLFAFLSAAVEPVSRLSGRVPPPETRALLDSLFALTLAFTLYGAALRARTRRLLEAEAELRELQSRLHDVERLSAVGSLAAGAAHDFNNALAIIQAGAELLLRDERLPESARADALDVQRAARSAEATAAGLLGVARRGVPGARCASLREAVEGPLDALTREFERRRIAVARSLADVPPCDLDLGLLSQVCLNLYLNARDALAAKGGGALRVTLQTRGAEAVLLIEDEGVGIPLEFQARLFRPFSTTKGARGTGLGLSSAKAVLESMGGTICCASTSGEGTSFRIALPLRPPARIPAAARTAAP